MHNFVIPVDNTTVSAFSTVPIGSIIAYLPGSFTATDNVGYINISQTLTSNWKVCNGRVSGATDDTATFLTDADSPIFNSAGRYLPNLTDSRFIMGYTLPTTGLTMIGGNTNNEYTLTAANLSTHVHTINHTHVWTSSYNGGSASDSTDLSHAHSIYNWFAGAGLPAPGLINCNTTGIDWPTEYADITHTHSTATGLNRAAGYDGSNVNVSANYPTSATTKAFSILPQYLKVIYIMRIK